MKARRGKYPKYQLTDTPVIAGLISIIAAGCLLVYFGVLQMRADWNRKHDPEHL